MSARAFWRPLLLLMPLAVLAAACDRAAPSAPEANAVAGDLASSNGASTVAEADLRRQILRRYKDEMWPCPEGYKPIQMHEYVASTPPPKPAGSPGYWQECPTTPGHFSNHNSSVGTASHIGRFTNEWDSCLDFVNLTGFFDAHLTAANGDRLDWQITANATPLPDGGIFFETTDVTFAGGTGRFSDASGYAAAAGGTNLGPGENYYYVGCLAY